MNFFKLYIGDYLRDTGTLTLAEHGAYVLMLMEAYATEKPLPTGKDLHRLLRADSKAEREAIDAVAHRYWTMQDGGLVNGRVMGECRRAADISDTNRAIAVEREAKKRARTGHEQSTKRAPSVPRNEDDDQHGKSTEGAPRARGYQTPDTRHQTKPPQPPRHRGGVSVHDFPPGFDRFWAEYPRKVAKPAAAHAFLRLRVDEGLLTVILGALARQRESPEWLKDRGRFIPHAATWLNGRRWEDVLDAAPAADKFVGAI